MKAMLESHPTPLDGAELRAATIESLLRCAAHCTMCADSCLAEGFGRRPAALHPD